MSKKSPEFQEAMNDQPKCPTCGTVMIQKSRPRLIIVGVCLVASLGLAVAVPMLWIPSLLTTATGIFLIVWATAGNGRWCRQCKTFKFQ
jgi:hypothetical protein